MALTYNQLLQNATTEYMDNMINNNKDAFIIEQELLEATNNAIDLRNATVDKSHRWTLLKKLEPIQIAIAISKTYHVCKIASNGTSKSSEYDILAIYQTSGYNKGIYEFDEDAFRKIARKFSFTLNKKDFEEVMIALRDLAPRKIRNRDEDLIAVNNGIFNYKTKELLDFDPNIVFLSKSHVDYVNNPINPILVNTTDGSEWDIESWMQDLNDDPEIVNLLWELLSAIIRPNVSWDKSAWLYSEVGNNGKGTLCQLMRNLCGDGAWASIPLTNFSKDFALETLINASAIIVDENDVGSYVDQAANLKAVITHDVITINRKYKSMIDFQFFGFMIQCLNEFPKIKDKSDSFYRRQIFIPMNKSFTGMERRYIKHDYMYNKEVLEYVLHKVLNTNFYTLSEPTSCRAVLDEYKEFNDPILYFFNDIVDELTWDLIPFQFLYDLYKAWMSENSPKGTIIGRNKFIQEIIQIANKTDEWTCPDKSKKIRVSNLMDKPELLIAKYNLENWQNKNYTGKDLNKLCQPNLSDSYRGLQRLIDIEFEEKPERLEIDIIKEP